MSNCIATLGGNSFDYETFAETHCFLPGHIAKVLSRIHRFGGHTRWPYTVAQHSVLVARLLEGTHAASHWSVKRRSLVGLLHDVPECFIGDIVGPLKKQMPYLHKLEQGIWKWIADVHGIDPGVIESDWLKDADRTALVCEARDLLENHDWIKDWSSVHQVPQEIEPWHPDYAADEWLRLYEFLTTAIDQEEPKVKCHYCDNHATQTLVWLKDKYGSPSRVCLPYCGCDLMVILKRTYRSPYPVVEGVDYALEPIDASLS